MTKSEGGFKKNLPQRAVAQHVSSDLSSRHDIIVLHSTRRDITPRNSLQESNSSQTGVSHVHYILRIFQILTGSHPIATSSEAIPDLTFAICTDIHNDVIF